MDAIAAMSSNWVIGKDGKLPWPSIPEDFKFFRKMTLGKTLVMGKNTFESLPFLKDREIIVLSNHGLTNPNYDLSKIKVITDISDIPQDAILAGGAKVYGELLPFCNTLYLTEIKKNFDGDANFPDYTIYANSCTILEEGFSEKAQVGYSIYEIKLK